jgi:hypothetical protein
VTNISRTLVLQASRSGFCAASRSYIGPYTALDKVTRRLNGKGEFNDHVTM